MVFTYLLYSGSSPDDVSLASWWSAVEVTSVDIERRDSFAHVTPSDTYIKAWYKLKELEVALCSTCLTTYQVLYCKLLECISKNRVFFATKTTHEYTYLFVIVLFYWSW